MVPGSLPLQLALWAVLVASSVPAETCQPSLHVAQLRLEGTWWSLRPFHRSLETLCVPAAAAAPQRDVFLMPLCTLLASLALRPSFCVFRTRDFVLDLLQLLSQYPQLFVHCRLFHVPDGSVRCKGLSPLLSFSICPSNARCFSRELCMFEPICHICASPGRSSSCC